MNKKEDILDDEIVETENSKSVRNFEIWFKVITGYSQFYWQKRLFLSLLNGDVPSALDLPTGLGKTSVILIWLLARAFTPSLPRRLVYVVDRRAVVDQATKVAETLRASLDEKAELADLRERLGLKGNSLPVSTLRGKFVDNREWLADPSIPSIIVGTIDMIGSRLLFEGYGVSRGMRRYHAGLLGRDSLFVLDESHLCPPFEALLHSIANDNGFAPCNAELHKIVPCFRFLPLSATGRKTDGKVFRLEAEDYQDDEVKKRLKAQKHLAIEIQEDRDKLVKTLADKAWDRRNVDDQYNRVLVYCDRREDAKKVADDLEGRLKKEKLPTRLVNLLVGARRVQERQQLAKWLEDEGFIAGSSDKLEAPRFLIATSAGEVGIDLDADHMVCDLVAFERMVQRLGRVNRRGKNIAHIDVIAFPPKPPKDNASADKKEIFKQEQAEFAARCDVIKNLSVTAPDKYNASPGEITELKKQAEKDVHLAEKIRLATTQEPLRPALSRALVDAWSMTSLEEHTGRPEIEPWLRGWIDKDEPESTVAWRHFLPWRDNDDQPNFNEVDTFFSAAPIHLSETLEAPSREIAETIAKRAAALLKSADSEAGAIRKLPIILVFNRAGKVELAFTLGKLADTDTKELKQLLQGKRIVISRLLGGLNSNGLLDGSADGSLSTIDCNWPEIDLQETIGYRIRIDESLENIADDWRIVHCFRLRHGDDIENPQHLVVEAFRGANAPRQGDPAISRFEQSLPDHHAWAGTAAEEIAIALGLPKDYQKMLVAAAQGHDLGKERELWQAAMNAPKDGRPYAKTKGGGNARLLGGYRHEFGSLGDVENDLAINELDAELKELALHLIASHHGYACPVIPAIDPKAPPSILAERAQEAALRFAKLQKRWGPWGLAWLEAVLRAADHRASRKLDEQQKKKEKE
jgi:CRISPR-associated endonuclease/helicase Cas3